MSTITIYGIKNCDTVKKARTWLDQHKIEYSFHDFRGDGLDEKLARQWIDELGVDTVVNKRGTTWRQLDDHTRLALTEKDGLNAKKAPALLAEKPTLIKRPVLDIGHQRFVGFDAKTWQTIFKTHTL